LKTSQKFAGKNKNTFADRVSAREGITMADNAGWMNTIKNEIVKDAKWALLLEVFQVILDPTAEYIAGKLPTGVTLKLRKFATEHEGLSKIAGVMFRSVTAGVLSLPGLSSLDPETRTMMNDVLDDAARYLLREIGREVLHGNEGSHIHGEGEAGHGGELVWIVDGGKTKIHVNDQCRTYKLSFDKKKVDVKYEDLPGAQEEDDDDDGNNNRRRRQNQRPRQKRLETKIDPLHGKFGLDEAERAATSSDGTSYCDECRPGELIKKHHEEHAKRAATLPPFEQFLAACDEMEGDLEGAFKEAFLEMHAWHLQAGNLPKVKALVEFWTHGGYSINTRLVRAFYFPKGQVA